MKRDEGRGKREEESGEREEGRRKKEIDLEAIRNWIGAVDKQ